MTIGRTTNEVRPDLDRNVNSGYALSILRRQEERGITVHSMGPDQQVNRGKETSESEGAVARGIQQANGVHEMILLVVFYLLISVVSSLFIAQLLRSY